MLANSSEPVLSMLKEGGQQREKAIELLRQYLVKGLSKSLSSRYGGQIQVDDVAQEAIIKILSSLDSFQSRSTFATWAMSVAIRIGISELRRRYYRDISIDLAQQNGQISLSFGGCTTGDKENDLLRTSLLKNLQNFINEKLTTKQRQAIRGQLEGLPVEIIAERLGSNRNAVYKTLHDARLRLRNEFERAGYDAQDILNALK